MNIYNDKNIRQNIEYLAKVDWTNKTAVIDRDRKVRLIEGKQPQAPDVLINVVSEIEELVHRKPELLRDTTLTDQIQEVRRKYAEKLQSPRNKLEIQLKSFRQLIFDAFSAGSLAMPAYESLEKFDKETKLLEAIQKIKALAENCPQKEIQEVAQTAYIAIEKAWQQLNQDFANPKITCFREDSTPIIHEFTLTMYSIIDQAENSLLDYKKERKELNEFLAKLRVECQNDKDQCQVVDCFLDPKEFYHLLVKSDTKALEQVQSSLLSKISLYQKESFIAGQLEKMISMLTYLINNKKLNNSEASAKSEFESLIKKHETYRPIFESLAALQIDYAHLSTFKIEDLRQVFKIIDRELVKRRATIISRMRNAIILAAKQQAFYIDSHKLLASVPQFFNINMIDKSHFNWYLSQAILLEKINDPTVDEETKKQLGFLILHSFSKVATIDPGVTESLGMQTTPLFPHDARYHRSEENVILDQITNAFARELHLNNNEFFLTDSAFIQEAITREMPQPIDLVIKDSSHFESVIDYFLTEALSGNFPAEPVMVNISSFVEDAHSLPQVTHRLEEIVTRKVKEFLDAHPEVEKEILIDKLISQFHLFSIFKHRNCSVIAIPQMSDHADIFRNSQDLPFASLKESHIKLYHDIRLLMVKGGFVLSPDQAKKAWLSVEGSSIFSKLPVHQSKLAMKGDKIPLHFQSISQFLREPIFNKFEELSNSANAPPYVQILTQATKRLLDGLLQCSTKVNGLHGLFRKKGIEELLQFSYFQIINAMNEAILRKDDLVQFNNQIEIIHQNIQNILEIAEPYEENECASAIIQKMTGGKNPLIPSTLGEPKVHLKASAMRGLSSVLSSIETQKQTKNLNIAVLKDSYYEVANVLKRSKTSQVSVLNGDLFNLSKDDAIDELTGPIDLFVCEYHHNISTKRREYSPENILGQVKEIFKRDLAAPQMTLLIDTTINLEMSDDIRILLADPEIQESIIKGRLNVVFLRSAQKFDMLGMDNYYGGITTAINNSQAFAGFNERMNDPDDQLRGLSYQGLTHLQRCCGTKIDDYRQAINDNTKRLYQSLPKEAVFQKGTKNPMQISAMKDDKLPFIDIKFPNYPLLADNFDSLLQNYADLNRLLLTRRSSFGFVNTNFTVIIDEDGTKKFRLNPGLESKETIAKYAEFFCRLQKAISIGVNQSAQYQEELEKRLEAAEVQLEKAKSTLHRAKTEEKAQAMADLDLAQVLYDKAKADVEKLKKNPYKHIDESICIYLTKGKW